MIDLDKILIVAEKNFFAKSYQDVKLDNIANDLNIKKPSLYYYFSNKREIFLETLKYSMKKYIKNLREIITENNIDNFLEWYLVYPSKEKNLFAIALQHQYLNMDRQIYTIIVS
jgi:AcrR family transcriptional regulator